MHQKSQNFLVDHRTARIGGPTGFSVDSANKSTLISSPDNVVVNPKFMVHDINKIEVV